MNNIQGYRFVCTLAFGDIYGQIIVWLVTITLSLAASLALMGATEPLYALATVALIILFSLPFLLFAFVTTLLNRIELMPLENIGTRLDKSESISHSRALEATI
ncbi:hypothetical protein RINTHH_4950 [Richelia intracellularis HH01]|uniref:Uncharacterized protein n=1 Tax=Richelia intracellularis HH01 TaxID=1165094 RepID=M1X2D8_9NOST|nr:hypothetical protein [Richelia intracellularis]CCH66650.1 hypothetical protein RINTHH_4950 [Richelia intracellularis HH01]